MPTFFMVLNFNFFFKESDDFFIFVLLPMKLVFIFSAKQIQIR